MLCQRQVSACVRGTSASVHCLCPRGHHLPSPAPMLTLLKALTTINAPHPPYANAAFMRALSRATSLSIPVSGLLISAAASILAAPLTLLLNTSITGDVTLSAAATLLFILNPASIFHAAIYTESLFTLLTLGGVCCLYVKPQPQPSPPHAGLIAVRFVAAAACFCLASCTRSNGE